MSDTLISSSVNQAIKLARLKLVSHHIQSNGLAKDAVDVCYGSSKGRISSRRKTRERKKREGESNLSVKSARRGRRKREGYCRKTTQAGREERDKGIGRGRERKGGGGGDRDEALANVAPAQVE